MIDFEWYRYIYSLETERKWIIYIMPSFKNEFELIPSKKLINNDTYLL